MTRVINALIKNSYVRNRKPFSHIMMGVVMILVGVVCVQEEMQAQKKAQQPQLSSSSVRKEALASALPAGCLPVVDSIFSCPALVLNKSLVVNYNSKREISHLGISLFSDEMKDLLNLPVCNFIERMMLELVLEQANENFEQKLDRLKLTLSKNGLKFGDLGFTSISSVLDEIEIPAQFSLVKEADNFAAVWKYHQNDQFVFAFPASRELIFGTDKKESDDLLNKSLFGSEKKCDESNNRQGDNVSEADLAYSQEKNIYTKKGVAFMMDIINSNTYYKKKGNAFELVFSKDYPAESFTNLIMKNMMNMNHKLHVTHRMYGNFSPDFDISLHEFLCYFQDDYNFYAVATISGKNVMKLTAILRNKEYNYIHLLLITAPVDNVFSKGGLLTAEFYSNIPQHNIRSLIGDITK